jgi:inorganic pyrophosphatase
MARKKPKSPETVLSVLFKAHPWHGVHIGPDAPGLVTAYIEIVPTDTVKYELDKVSGLLQVDRPQRFSNLFPALYGLIPQTFCGPKVGELCAARTGRKVVGDNDPLDICVLTEKAVSHGDFLLKARPIGGLRMIDRNEADDKIIAVLEGDAAYGEWRDVSDAPRPVIDRLRHYFLTYKQPPEDKEPRCEITHTYGREEALKVIRCSMEDYQDRYGSIELVEEALGGRKGRS